MKIENAHYTKEPSNPTGSEKIIGINCKIDGKPFFVAIGDEIKDADGNVLIEKGHANRHYREIMRQKDAGIITIADAD